MISVPSKFKVSITTIGRILFFTDKELEENHIKQESLNRETETKRNDKVFLFFSSLIWYSQ